MKAPTKSAALTSPSKAATAQLRTVLLDALASVDNARQKCIAAGQLLNELKATHGHGDFMELVLQTVPEISHDTAGRWMRAAANVLKALPPMAAIDIEASVILATPDAELTKDQLEWKQGWFTFTDGKTIKECLNSVFVDGDEPHRIDRAINGKTKGGAGGDRKDFPLFVAVKLKDMGQHFGISVSRDGREQGHWKGMSEKQKTEIKSALVAAINGGELHLQGRKTFQFKRWPEDICRVMQDALRDRLKGVKA